jgi:DnaJ-class molecular chaperone
VKDYYQILGVPRNASEDDIKRAFRKQAMQHHPDRGGDQNRFQEINEAYATLSDPKRRAEYDNPRPQFGPQFGGMPGGFNMDEIFNMFGVNMRQGRQGQNPRIALWVTLEDAARGGPRMISLQLGNSVNNVEIDIPVGIGDGDTIRYPRLSPDGNDLVVTYRFKPDPKWQRDQQNITTERVVELWDLILGCEIPVTDLTGATLMLHIPPRTQPGSLLRLKGRGLPASTLPGRAGGRPGDLFVRVQAQIPTVIDDGILSAIRKAKGL